MTADETVKKIMEDAGGSAKRPINDLELVRLILLVQQIHDHAMAYLANKEGDPLDFMMAVARQMGGALAMQINPHWIRDGHEEKFWNAIGAIFIKGATSATTMIKQGGANT